MSKRTMQQVDVLGAILGGAAPVSGETRAGTLHLVALDQILDNPFQAREEDDLDHVIGIAKSMAAMKADLPGTLGMQQPPTGRLVRVHGDQVEAFDPFVYKSERIIREALADDSTRVQLHFGHSRRQAFRVLALGVHAVFPHLDIPAQLDMGVTRDDDYARMPLFLAHADRRALLVHVATENAQRKDLSAVEEAVLLRRAIDEGMSTEEAGALFGWARSTAANKLRLLDLPADVQKMVRRGAITERAARELCRLVEAPKLLADTVHELTQGDGISTGRLVSNVNYRVEEIKKAKKKQAEYDAAAAVLAQGWEPWPGAGLLPADRLGLREGKPEWQHKPITANSDACKFCSNQCPCMRLIATSYAPNSGAIKPDPAKAPSIFLACADQKRQDRLFAEHRKSLETDPKASALDEQEKAALQAEVDAKTRREAQKRQEKIEAIRRESDALWIEFKERTSRQELWGSLAFWKLVSEIVSWSLGDVLKPVSTPGEAVDALLDKMRDKTCHEYNRELEEYVTDPKKLKELIRKLENRKRNKEEEPAEVVLPVL